jgi:hypothetical protein
MRYTDACDVRRKVNGGSVVVFVPAFRYHEEKAAVMDLVIIKENNDV